MISILFDDLIYQLQQVGGVSVYWREVTGRVAGHQGFRAARLRPSQLLRGVPVRAAADIFHSSHFRTAFPGRARVVSTVHDLNYELGYVPTGLGVHFNVLERKLSYFTADALICVSNSTRMELLQVYPRLQDRCPIHVIHHGFTRLTDAEQTFRAPAHSGPYVLYVGGRWGYKRFDDALLAFKESSLWRDGVKLICTGTPLQAEETKRIAALGLSEHIVNVGRADDAMLGALYAGAHCLVYPSIHEGFGLPLLEAMSCGCPVIACNTSCIPEIAGDAALLVKPSSPGEIAAAMLSLQEQALRSKLIAAGKARAATFSWDESAQRHMDVYRTLARAA